MKNKKGFTLIEVLLAVVIFSAVALPLLGVYLQAVKTDVVARDVLNANYIAQDYIEQLDTRTYAQALSALPSKQQTGGYYLSASLRPHGIKGDLFSSSCVYAQLLMGADGQTLAVMPDGKWQLFSAIPAQVSLSVADGAYALSCDGTTMTGAAAYNNCVLVVNAAALPEGASPQIVAGTGCKALIYCTSANASAVTLTGEGIKHKNVLTGESSLVHVTAKVYDTADSAAPIAQSEAYLNIRNWS